MVKYFCVFIITIATSCATIYQPKKAIYYDYRVNRAFAADSGILTMLTTYSDSINKTMNLVIAQATETLEKKQPNGSLGLILVDAMRQTATAKYGVNVDAAFVNNGGIRIPTVAKGNITVGKVYEIMPFDNLIIIQNIKGNIFNDFIQLMAKRGGWPSSGITYTLAKGKATNIMVGDIPLDMDKTYVIANSDYIANGGDDADMLRPLPQQNNNILMREAFLEYFKNKNAKGEKISPPQDSDRVKSL